MLRHLVRLLLSLAFVCNGVVADEHKPMVSQGLLSRHSPGYSLFDYLDRKTAHDAEKQSTDGWAYVISGSAAVLISTPGYYLTSDVFGKIVYAAAQTAGFAAIGVGASMVMLDQENRSFIKVVKKVPELTQQQRDKLALAYLQERAATARKARTLNVITGSLSATSNIVDALIANNEDLRTVHMFLGGVSVLSVLHSLFTETTEEQTLRLTTQGVQVSFRF